MNRALSLQAGGTLNPRKHIYIVRPEDDRLVKLLLAGEYVNVLTCRQMGKSSLMMRAVQRLAEHGVRFVAIDLGAEMGTPDNVEAFYVGLLSRFVRDLRLNVEITKWWREHAEETFNQRLLRFFREVLSEAVREPLVVFLDEIDSTLKLPFTDDLFTAIRSMYNDRPLVPAFERITFCLLGVASANELVKDRRSTPYNVGESLELGDFDASREDVTALSTALSDDPPIGAAVLQRVLYWTGGHPYLTARLCVDLRDAGASSVADVDRHVETAFVALDRVRADPHFDQTLRFVETRLTSGRAALSLYRRILRGAREKDVPAVAHSELKLSGLVKRDAQGYLVVRNPIYRRLFDLKWVESLSSMRERGVYRFVAICAALLAAMMGILTAAEAFMPAEIGAVAVSPDGRTIAAGASDGVVRFWDLESARELRTLRHEPWQVTSVAFSPDGRRVATGSFENNARIWDVETGAPVLVLTGHGNVITSVAFSPDGRKVATASWDTTARLWDVETGELLRTFTGQEGWMRAVAFSPVGNVLALAGDGSVGTRLWHIETGELLATLQGERNARCVAFAPDGRKVATGSYSGLSLWDAASGTRLRQLDAGSVGSVAFSQDGRTAATGSDDGSARLWDVETGALQQPLSGHMKGVSSLAFTPDGRSIVTGSADGATRLWNTKTGEQRRYYGTRWGTVWAAMGTSWRLPTALLLLALLLMLDFVVLREIVGGALPAARRALWSMVVLLFPLLGILAWLFARPGRASARTKDMGSGVAT
jgi:hypothetical protein